MAGARAIFVLKDIDRGWRSIVAASKQATASHGAVSLGDVESIGKTLLSKGKSLASGWGALLAKAQRTTPRSRDTLWAKTGLIGSKAEEEHPVEAGEEPMTNVALGVIHEFGSPPRIPERSFMRATFDLRRPEYVAGLDAIVRAWFDAKGKFDLKRALRLMGLKMESDIKNRILEGAGIPPPNAPSTIERKLRKGEWKKRTPEETAQLMAEGKGPRPLIDTGRMFGAISHALVRGDDEDTP